MSSENASEGPVSPKERLEALKTQMSAGKAKKAPAGAAKATKPAPVKPAGAKGAGNFGKLLASVLRGLAGFVYGPRKPVHQEIIESATERLPDIVEKLYAQDEWVRKGIDWINGKVGRTDAWGEAAMLAVTTYAALQVADGKDVPIVGLLAAPIVADAAHRAAYKIAAAEAIEAGHLDAENKPIIDPRRVEFLLSVLTGADVAERAA